MAHSSDSYLMIHIFVSDSISLVDNVHGYGLCWTELFACCIAFGRNSQGILDLKRILGFGLVIIFFGQLNVFSAELKTAGKTFNLCFPCALRIE